MEQSQMIHFREVQYIRHVWWVMLLVLGVAALMWWGFVQQILLGAPWGKNPSPDWLMWILWLIIGIGFPLAFYWMRLIVEVLDDKVTIRYVPLVRNEFLLDEIEGVEARTYQPIREYGGWGIRGLSSKRAYNVSGDKGVELTLADGRKVMIGSQRAEELALVILNAQEIRF
jgi:hypothetical protein